VGDRQTAATSAGNQSPVVPPALLRSRRRCHPAARGAQRAGAGSSPSATWQAASWARGGLSSAQPSSLFTQRRSPVDVQPASASTIADGMRSGNDKAAFANTTCCLSTFSAHPLPQATKTRLRSKFYQAAPACRLFLRIRRSCQLLVGVVSSCSSLWHRPERNVRSIRTYQLTSPLASSAHPQLWVPCEAAALSHS
jgi:hypothetical protein